MMAECEVFGSLVLSNNQDEKRDNSEKHSEEESSEEEQNVDVDWMNESEFPPLVSRGVELQVERCWSSPSWVATLRKNKPRRPVDSKATGEKQNEKSRANLLDAKVEISRDSHVASSEICSTDELVTYMGNGLSTEASAPTLFTVKIPIFDNEVLKLQVDEKASLGDDIRLQNQENGYEDEVDQVRSAPTYVKLKREEVDSHLFISRTVRYALPFDDIDCQEGFEQQMLADEHLKTPKKELDLKHVTIEKVEEEMGVELKAEKREKRRQKRLRLKERKKVVAVARDGFSLDSTPTQANNIDFVSQISNPVEVGMLEQTETHESQDEASSSSLNMHQKTTELLELVEGNDIALMAQHRAELKEKRRNKNMAKKERKKGMAATTTRDKSNKKWILIIFTSLTLLLCLTIMDLQILSQIFH